ncbi:MAG: LapA family protein [Solirubrobacterales bacterium]|nr:LapA family protein [Solirubrobacterales bacterium]
MSVPADSPSAQTPGRKRPRRESARTTVLVVVAVLITVFAVLNVKEVSVNWIVGSAKVPLIVVIVVSLAAGVVLGAFAAERRRRNR